MVYIKNDYKKEILSNLIQDIYLSIYYSKNEYFSYLMIYIDYLDNTKKL